YREAAKSDVKNIYYRKTVSDHLIAMGRKREAQLELELACKIDPQNTQAYKMLAEFYDYNLQVDEAIETYEKIVRIDERNIGARRSLVELYKRKGNYEMAIQHQSKILEISPDADNPFAVAQLLAKAGRIDEAVAEYRDYIDKNKESSLTVRFDLAAMLAENGRYDEAIAEYDELAKDGRFKTDVMARKADVYLKQGNFEMAMDHCKQVLAEQPSNNAALDIMSKTYRQQNKGNEWLEFLKQHIKESKHLQPYKYFLTEYKAAGKFEEGMTFLETLIDERPDDRRVVETLAQAMAEADNFEKAVELYKKMLNPDERRNTSVYLSLAGLYEKMGKDEEAVQEYRKYLAQLDSPDQRIKLAMLLEKMGRNNEALVEYEHVIKISPNNGLAQDAVKRLKTTLGISEASETRE
ncbi:MAG TPA: tetratricopeptide repeat protein, partial [Armatimonadota bacterium]|nr:tetratricopeptide repeat protein [Armatimonadota bacterium]